MSDLEAVRSVENRWLASRFMPHLAMMGGAVNDHQCGLCGLPERVSATHVRTIPTMAELTEAARLLRIPGPEVVA